MDNPLFQGSLIRFAPIDHENDPQVLARWTQDAGFMRLFSLEPARPRSIWEMKKKLEELEKNLEEERNRYYFHVRTLEADRLVGTAELNSISWSNGTGCLQVGIADAGDRRKGFGGEALRMLLRFAFCELNLHRLTAVIPEYNLAALSLFAKYGFMEEVRRRQALERDGRFWDLHHYGLLAGEWKEALK